MFHNPWFLLLLLLVPWLAWRMVSNRRRQAITFSSIQMAAALRPSWRQRLIWLPNALALLALTLMIISLARPREGRDQTVVESEGIAIELVVDRSGSMQAMDFQIDGHRVDRLSAVKRVASEFVLGDAEFGSTKGELSGRVSDLIGLISFARYADAITPPTLDHSFLTAQLGVTQIETRRGEDGTAIGDAISLAVEKLTTLDERRDTAEKVKSKVIILLTDGENTAGEFDPLQAAELAAKMKTRIYTIGVGTRGQAPFPVYDRFTGRPSIRLMPVNIDEGTLQKIADTTGGKYFRATDTESLKAIYAEIDKLERTKVEASHFVDYRELAIQPTYWGAWTLPPLLLVALVALLMRVALAQLILREFV